MIDPCIAIDCQTTGASPAHGDLLEVAWAVTTAEGAVLERHAELIEQEYLLPSRISQLTGITDDDLEDAAPLDSVLERLGEAIAKYKPQCFLAHYARFEANFLKEAFARVLTTPLDLPFLCTYEVARRLHPNLPSRGIRALAGFYGSPITEYKRAACHLDATLFIKEKLFADLCTQHKLVDAAAVQEWIGSTVVKRAKSNQYAISREVRLALPKAPGIYKMKAADGSILYIGKATSLRDRVNSYFRGRKGKSPKIKEMLTQVKDIDVEPTATETEAALLETDLIKNVCPPYNTALKLGSREICFLSKDLRTFSPSYTEATPVGPFTSKQDFAFLLALPTLTDEQALGWLTTRVFYGLDDIGLIIEGYRLFAEQLDFDLEAPDGMRRLLARGLARVRRKRKEAALAEELLEEEEFEDEEGEESEAVEEEEDWTSESVCSAIWGTVGRCARTYLRARRIERLANSIVAWKLGYKGKTWRVLSLSGGVIQTRHSIENIRQLSSHRTEKAALDRQFNINDYDRLRVLDTELMQHVRNGRRVRIIFADGISEFYQ